jgi:hypothetical protein
MIDVLKQFEAVPVAYPTASVGLSAEAAALDPAMIWARIEDYIAHRFTDREIVWTLIGNGGDQFHPRLTPVTSSVADLWTGEAWEAVTLLQGPLGLCLPSDGTYRITAQVGAGVVPAPVSEAFRRLAEYLAGARGSTDEPGASSSKFSIGGELDFEVTRSPAWVARAMQYSGAGDLLRPYRRA